MRMPCSAACLCAAQRAVNHSRRAAPPKNNPSPTHHLQVMSTTHIILTLHTCKSEGRDVEYEDEENGDEGVPSNIHKSNEEMPLHCDTSHDRRRNCEKLSRIHDVVLVCSTGRDSSFFLILFLFI
jgi:hypothetical protein